MKNTKPTRTQRVKNYQGKIVVGIDTHKKDYHVCLWNTEEKCKLRAWVQPSDDRALVQALEPYRGQVTQIVYEAESVGFSLARNLLATAGLVPRAGQDEWRHAGHFSPRCGRWERRKGM